MAAARECLKDVFEDFILVICVNIRIRSELSQDAWLGTQEGENAVNLSDSAVKAVHPILSTQNDDLRMRDGHSGADNGNDHERMVFDSVVIIFAHGGSCFFCVWFLLVYVIFEEGMKDFFFESIKVPVELLQWGDVKEKKNVYFCPILTGTRSDVPPVKSTSSSDK